MRRTVVCTFATEAYAGSAEVLRHTALRVGLADEVIVFREADVAPWFAAYPELRGGRGYGWWSWKPWCVLEAMRRSRPGDVVVYCDAAVAFVAPLTAHADAVRHALLFRLGGWQRADYRNRCWTKRDTFAMMECADDEHRDAVQLNAAVQVYRHTPEAVAFVERYRSWCTRREVIDDARVLENYAGFVDHRHDQSILSLLAVGCPDVDVARDPTQHGADDPTDGPGLTPVPCAPPQLLDHHRARRRPVRVAVVTPTVGGPHLRACVASVQAQDLPNVVHYVVVDGPRFRDGVLGVLREFRGRGEVHVVELPHNVGSGGWNGHRVYGAMPWLVDAKFVAFLDEDNEFDADHLRHLVREVVATRVPWGHSLRRIVDQDGRDVCPDNCESLGGITHTVCGPGDHLVDTSCFLIDRDLAISVAGAWNVRARDPSGREPDRELTKLLLSTAPAHAAVRRHSVRYRAGSTAASVQASFFERGNAELGYDFAARPDLYVFHFDAAATAALLACRRRADRSYALDEWQMTLLRGLDRAAPAAAGPGHPGFNLLNGYACAPRVPRGAAVYVSMCHPHEVPWDWLRERVDLWRVAYTAESPNIRHAAQWDPERLRACFDVVLTYFQPLLDDGRVRTVFCPHNTHHLDLDDPLDAAQLRSNRGAGRSCCMVLERRDLGGQYSIPNLPGVTLTCLDPLRELVVKDLDDVTVFGQGWDAAAARHPGVKLGHALHRSRDPRHSVDIMQDFTFAVIVENCDAEGYVSEKLFNALMAGAIPLHYGGGVPAALDVPKGVQRGVYLDVRRLAGASCPPEAVSRVLRDFLRGLTDAEVAAWRQRVADLRADVLRRVGTAAFAKCVREALALRG